MPRITTEQAGGANRGAFLDMIARSEGTVSDPATRDDGYDVLVTGLDGPQRFDSYAAHPDVLVKVNGNGLESTAAGRYQLLYRYWVSYQKQLALPDFGPISQDRIALQQMRECNALPDIDIGNFAHAVALCSRIWASLPGNDYGQHENAIALLQGYYAGAGGTLSTGATA